LVALGAYRQDCAWKTASRERSQPRITAKYDQIVPPFYTQELTDLIFRAKSAEIPSGHLSFLEKPGDLASAMLTFLLEKHP
jgi:pimeloyl-ACP methyl ester carboxylesterase